MGKLPRGITRTKTGYLVRVSVGRRGAALRASKRFPLSATFAEMRAWQDRERVKLRSQQPTAPKKGTFADDVRRYLALVTGMPTYKERKYHLGLWVGAYGGLARSAITSVHVRSQLERWRVQRGDAASTLNHLRTALSHVYTLLDGKGGANPCRDVRKYREPPALPRGLSYAVIGRVLTSMGETKSHARLAALAYTSVSPSEQMRIDPSKVDLRLAQVIIPPRQKGHGVPARVVPLNADGVAAFRLWLRVDAKGRYSTSSARKAFLRAYDRERERVAQRWLSRYGPRALSRLERIWPLQRPRPYDLRHSFLGALFLATGNVQAVADMGGHKDLRTTRRYTLRAVPPVLRAAVGSVGRITRAKSF